MNTAQKKTATQPATMTFMTLLAGAALGIVAYVNKEKIASGATALGSKIGTAFDDLATGAAPARA